MLRILLFALILLTGAPAYASDGYVDAVLNLGPRSPEWKQGIAKLGDQHHEELLDRLKKSPGITPGEHASITPAVHESRALKILLNSPPGDASLLARRVATRMADLETTPCVWHPDVLLAARRHCLYRGQPDPIPAILDEWISTGEEPRQLAALEIMQRANLPTSSSLPLLEKTLASSHAKVVDQTLYQLGMLRGAMAPLSPKLISMLGSADESLRISVCSVLGAGLPATLPDLLIAATSADDPMIRGCAVSITEECVGSRREELARHGYTPDRLGEIAAPWLATQLDCEGTFRGNLLRDDYGQLLGRLGQAGNGALLDAISDPRSSDVAKQTAIGGLASAVRTGTLPGNLTEAVSMIPGLFKHSESLELSKRAVQLEEALATRAAKTPPP